MNAHVIENNTVANTIVVLDLNALPNLVDASIGGAIGWGYVDGVLIPPPPLVPEPLTVSPRQIRQALTATGMRAAVEAGVAASDQDTIDWWERATSFEEDHPMIDTMATALGITDEQRHAVFVLANTL
jgi:hypothetical protein